MMSSDSDLQLMHQIKQNEHIYNRNVQYYFVILSAGKFHDTVGWSHS